MFQEKNILPSHGSGYCKSAIVKLIIDGRKKKMASTSLISRLGMGDKKKFNQPCLMFELLFPVDNDWWQPLKLGIQGKARRLHARKFRIASAKQYANTFQPTTTGCTATALQPECSGQMGMLFMLHSLR